MGKCARMKSYCITVQPYTETKLRKGLTDAFVKWVSKYDGAIVVRENPDGIDGKEHLHIQTYHKPLAKGTLTTMSKRIILKYYKDVKDEIKWKYTLKIKNGCSNWKEDYLKDAQVLEKELNGIIEYEDIPKNDVDYYPEQKVLDFYQPLMIQRTPIILDFN